MALRFEDRELESADSSTIKALQLEKLRALLDKTWHRNAFYREHWRKAGVTGPGIASLDDFKDRFPPVRKADFMADQVASPPYGLRAKHVADTNEPLMVCTTSGTSGQGVEFHAETMAERLATVRISNYLHRWAGLERGDRVFLMFPITLLGGGRVELFGLEAYGLTVFPVGNYDVKRKIELMQQWRPHAVQATASYLGHLAAVGDARALGQGLKALFAAGEGGGYAWFERLQEQWGTPVYSQYGSTQSRVDMMYCCEQGIGTRARPGLLHNIAPYFVLDVVDPATGRRAADGDSGEIVLTSLIHDDVPLIRCATNDRGVWHDHRYCTCGRPFDGVEIGSISRIDDMVKLKGVNVWPQTVDDLLFEVPEMDEYQIVVDSDHAEADVVTARIMPKEALSDADAPLFETRIREALRSRTGISFAVQILPQGTLARSEYKARRWIDNRSRNRV